VESTLANCLVPSKGLEPPHRCRYMDLNHARLPIPPRWQVDFRSSSGGKLPDQETCTPILQARHGLSTLARVFSLNFSKMALARAKPFLVDLRLQPEASAAKRSEKSRVECPDVPRHIPRPAGETRGIGMTHPWVFQTAPPQVWLRPLLPAKAEWFFTLPATFG
jgi:hypothetical protein